MPLTPQQKALVNLQELLTRHKDQIILCRAREKGRYRLVAGERRLRKEREDAQGAA